MGTKQNFSENKFILAAIVFLLLLIPLTSYFMLQKAKFEHLVSSQLPSTVHTLPQTTLPKTTSASAYQEMKTNIAALPSASPGFIMDSEPAVLGSESTPSGGLKIQVKMDERPANNQQTRLFIGISQGVAVQNPKYLLSFLVDLDQNGSYSGISLTGLEPNVIYTAYIKGVSQLATSKEFTYNPQVTDLGLIPLISGDTNNDNIINSTDYNQVKENLGKTSDSVNFNSALDVNNDGVVNSLDLAIISQNMGKSGEIGVVIPDQINSSNPSASIPTPVDIGSPEASSSAKSGYWLWIPKID